jgi:type VI secretion system protein ImpF
MADLPHDDQYQPSLLDRLTDENPQSKSEGREHRVQSVSQLRRAVLRDLAWLLSTRAHTREQDEVFYEYKHVARSVLNFGLPSMLGEETSGLRPDDVRRAVAEAIRTYEPRIDPGTLEVRIIEDPSQAANPAGLTFEISGQLLTVSGPEWLTVETRLDPQSGQTSLDRYLESAAPTPPAEAVHG